MPRKSGEVNAWNAYLKETRDLSGRRYEEVESWAWNRLTDKLGNIAKRQGEKKVAA